MSRHNSRANNDVNRAGGDVRRPDGAFSKAVATHYNEIQEVGREARLESKIIHMRSFNNWIKSMLIGEALDEVRKNRDYHTQITVLDIGCGKGGDLRKWKFGRIHHLIGTDIAETSLEQCRDRYRDMIEEEEKNTGGGYRRNNHPLFTAEFFAADATRDRLRDKFRDPKAQVDVVSIQFVYHYSFESVEQAEMMLQNASENLRTGGFLIGTTPDSLDIVQRARQAKSKSFGNDIYNITFDSDDILDVNKEVPIFGAQYHFSLEGVVNCPEFLVYFPVLEKMALKYGLKLVKKKRFEDYYEEMKDTNEGRTTLRRMRVFEPYPSNKGRLASDTPGDYDHAEEYWGKVTDKKRALGTLSKSEWEAISLYCIFVFQKLDPKETRALLEEQRRTSRVSTRSPKRSPPKNTDNKSSNNNSSSNNTQSSSLAPPKKKFFSSRTDENLEEKKLNAVNNCVMAFCPKPVKKPNKFFKSRNTITDDRKPTYNVKTNNVVTTISISLKTQNGPVITEATTSKTLSTVKATNRSRPLSPKVIESIERNDNVDVKKEPVKNNKKAAKAPKETKKSKATLRSPSPEVVTKPVKRSERQTRNSKRSATPEESREVEPELKVTKVEPPPRVPTPEPTPEPVPEKVVPVPPKKAYGTRGKKIFKSRNQENENNKEAPCEIKSCIDLDDALVTKNDVTMPEIEDDDQLIPKDIPAVKEIKLPKLSSPPLKVDINEEVEFDKKTNLMSPRKKSPQKDSGVGTDSSNTSSQPENFVKPDAAPQKRKFFSSRNKNAQEKKIIAVSNFAKAFVDDFDDPMQGNGSPSANGSESSSGQSSGTSSSGSQDYYYVQRIKKAHQCHELGETEAFDGDIKFYLDGLSETNAMSMRYLSTIGLATQCMRTEFRMHLRAHDDMPSIIRALKDSPNNATLAFCTATLMFVYNQDRLTMDIDATQLSLMLDLLESKDETADQVEKRHMEKAKELVEQMKQRNFGKFLDPNKLTTGKLAMEALLGLTSKRAGDWFKDELRKLKGIDFLMNTCISLIENDENLSIESELSKIDRTLRVLEGATHMHEGNQIYAIEYQQGRLITACITLLRSNKDNIVMMSDSKIYLSSLMSVLRLFTNITSESGLGSEMMGTKFEHLFELLLEIMFEVPSFIVPDSRFDLTIIILCLCINLVEYCKHLRTKLLQSRIKLRKLVDILLDRFEQAKDTEGEADKLFENAENDKNKNEVVNIDTLLNQVVAQSGKHMEHSIIAACISLVLGCSIQDDPVGKAEIATFLPNKSFDPLVDVLRKLHEFAHLADIMTPSGVARVERILHVFTGGAPQRGFSFGLSKPASSGNKTYSRKPKVESVTIETSDKKTVGVYRSVATAATTVAKTFDNTLMDNTTLIDEDDQRPSSPSLLSLDNSFFNNMTEDDDTDRYNHSLGESLIY